MGYVEVKKSFIRYYKKALKLHPDENVLKIAFILYDKAEFHHEQKNVKRAFDTMLQARELAYFIAMPGVIDFRFTRVGARRSLSK